MSAAQVQFLPGSDVNPPDNVTSSEFVYYRVYHKDGAIATKRPAYLNDIYIGRIRSKWVTPPHTAGSLQRCLSSLENINPNKTQLFPSASNRSALADEAPISLTSNQTLGIIPQDPVILFSEAMPQAKMQPGTESLLVPPDSKSPLAPRFLFYGVYSEAGVRSSKAPIDAEKPWVSKIDLYSIMPPVSVTSLLHILDMKEGINTSSGLLAQDGLTPLGDDQIFNKDGSWLGASAEDHLVLKFSPLFAEGVPYRIRNCCTGNFLEVQYNTVRISLAAYSNLNSPYQHFTLSLQDDGSVGICNIYGTWIASYRHTSQAKCGGFWLIPSTTKNSFFIRDVSPEAFYFYDAQGTSAAASDAAGYIYLELRVLDTTDTRQMWSLIPKERPVPVTPRPVTPIPSRQAAKQSCCLVV